jgi:Double-GTPase 2
MQILGKKCICPYCFSQITPRNVLFRCINPVCAGKKLAPRVPLIGFPQVAICDTCNTESYRRICPNCDFELSSDLGLVDQQLIAIIGGRDTGKSHYIAALIHKLQHETGQNFTFSLRFIGDNTQKRWEDDFETPLFVRRSILQSTKPGYIDASVKKPLIFRLTMTSHGRKRALNISFLDSAGEDMRSQDALDLQVPYIRDASAIIFLLDPLQISSVRQLLPGVGLPHQSQEANPEAIVGRVCELIRSHSHLAPTRKIKTPIAFTLSKIDALRSILPPDSALLRNSEHFGYLDIDDVKNVHTEIANDLRSWISYNFCQQIDHDFETYRYFGVSSLGSPPDKDGHLISINPIRVEDPFLWILQQFDLIKGRKGR